MKDQTLALLQASLLIVDATGIFQSWVIAQYYKLGKDEPPVFCLYVLFMVLFLMFVCLTVSDVLVIVKVSNTWATLPIIRGLVFRLPLSAVEFWMIYKLYYGADKER